MAEASPAQRLEAIARALALGPSQRHILVCAEAKAARCATREEGQRVWSYLKRRLHELGLSSQPPRWGGAEAVTTEEAVATPAGCGRVLRNKVDCLRVCEQGPIAVVYPEGTWYRGLSVEVMERIIQQHLIGGSEVSEHVFARAPLGCPAQKLSSAPKPIDSADGT